MVLVTFQPPKISCFNLPDEKTIAPTACIPRNPSGALEAGESDEVATAADVEQLLGTVPKLSWEKTEAVGEGDEFRAESDKGDHASALVFDQAVVHGSVVAAV